MWVYTHWWNHREKAHLKLIGDKGAQELETQMWMWLAGNCKNQESELNEVWIAVSKRESDKNLLIIDEERL